jgi:hypothetical protein
MGFSPGYIHIFQGNFDGTMIMSTFSTSKMKLLCTQTTLADNEIKETLPPETQKQIAFSGFGFFTINQPWITDDPTIDARVPLLVVEYHLNGAFKISHYFLDPLDPLPVKASFTHESVSCLSRNRGMQALLALGCAGQTIVWAETLPESRGLADYWLASIPRSGEPATVRRLEMPDEVRLTMNVCKLALDDIMGRLVFGLEGGGFVIYNLL